MKKYAVRICDFAGQPSEEECLQAIWSQGKACRTCGHKCYRRGWSKQQVTADNKKRVGEKCSSSGL